MNFEWWRNQWADGVKRRLNRVKENPQMEYWDRRADDFSAYRKSRNYEFGRKICQVCQRFLGAESTILDIGAGPGSFVIPFCQAFKYVTAIEPSRNMIRALENNCSEESISNYSVIQSKIEDVQSEMLGKQYDLVICSLVLWLFEDIWPMLEQIESYSKRFCAIVVNVPDLKHIDGEVKGDVTEFLSLYNLLITAKRVANVEMVSYLGEKTIQEEVDFQLMMKERGHKELSESMQADIYKEVESQSKNGKYLVESRAAVIWWDKTERIKTLEPY